MSLISQTTSSSLNLHHRSSQSIYCPLPEKRDLSLADPQASVSGFRMLSLGHSLATVRIGLESVKLGKNQHRFFVKCEAKGPRPRYPRVWKTTKKIGTISKSLKLVECIKGLSNVKEEVYGALDSFIAWELEFPLITVKKALKSLEHQKEWKRIIQVTKWMLSKGQGRTMGSYYTLLNALAEDGRMEEAEELWKTLFSQNLESMPRMFFEKMVSIYHRKEMHEKMFEIFADMEELGIRPSVPIVTMVGEAFKKLGMLDKYVKLGRKYPPPRWEYRYVKGKRIKVKKQYHNTNNNQIGTSTNSEVNKSDVVDDSESLKLNEDDGDDLYLPETSNSDDSDSLKLQEDDGDDLYLPETSDSTKND